MPSYLRQHRSGYVYQRSVPVDLRPYIGKDWWRHYVPDAGKSNVETFARAMAARHDDLITALRDETLSEGERAQLARDGGLAALPTLAGVLGVLNGYAALPRPTASRRDVFNSYAPGTRVATMGRAAFYEASDDGERERAAVSADVHAVHDRVQAIALKVDTHLAATADVSLSGLLALWIKVREPKCTAEHAATVALFNKLCGDLDYRNVTSKDVQAFRDGIEGNGRSAKNQTRQLERLSALFAVAVSEGKMVSGLNPVRGVAVRGKDPRAAIIVQQSFSGPQTAHILERAEDTGFGDKRATAALWALRLMAWTGARPNEVLALQRGDVVTVASVPCIMIRAMDAVTGKKHPLKSVKNKESVRTVPLHSSIATGFLAFAVGDASEFVFGCFPHNSSKGRYHWFGLNFGTFLSDVCDTAAKDSAHRLSLYSLRHGFIDAMRRARVPLDHQNMIVGHSGGIHGGYGGDIIKTLAADVESVNVLAD